MKKLSYKALIEKLEKHEIYPETIMRGDYKFPSDFEPSLKEKEADKKRRDLDEARSSLRTAISYLGEYPKISKKISKLTSELLSEYPEYTNVGLKYLTHLGIGDVCVEAISESPTQKTQVLHFENHDIYLEIVSYFERKNLYTEELYPNWDQCKRVTPVKKECVVYE